MSLRFLEQQLNELAGAQKGFFESQSQVLLDVVQLLVKAFERGNKLMIMGNGGSAADAQHLAAEFVNRFRLDRPPLPALALTTDTSVLTSIGNDFGFEQVFEKQILALGQPDDIVLGISTSGYSENIIRGFKAAREKKILTVALAGNKGGEMIRWADYALIVPSGNTPRIQEVQILIGHLLCELVETRLYGPAQDQEP
jgi:D-sedoheptulose 7-phosphate isomerase